MSSIRVLVGTKKGAIILTDIGWQALQMGCEWSTIAFGSALYLLVGIRENSNELHRNELVPQRI